MAKVYPLKNAKGEIELYVFQCPGCGYGHNPSVIVWQEGGNPVWTFNGDLDKPTFSPSILVFKDDPSMRCHSFVKDGRIQFLSDCFHSLKGQTVDLPDWE